MTPAPSAGGEEKRKKSRRRRPRRKKSASATDQNNSKQSPSRNEGAYGKINRTSGRPSRYTKRVDEVSAGGLVVDSTGTRGLLIARRDQKDQTRLIWSLPKGHIEAGETPEIGRYVKWQKRLE